MTYIVKGTMPDGMITFVEVPVALYHPRDFLEATAISMRIAPGFEPESVKWDDGKPADPV